jgi:hypothetical protein
MQRQPAKRQTSATSNQEDGRPPSKWGVVSISVHSLQSLTAKRGETWLWGPTGSHPSNGPYHTTAPCVTQTPPCFKGSMWLQIMCSDDNTNPSNKPSWLQHHLLHTGPSPRLGRVHCATICSDTPCTQLWLSQVKFSCTKMPNHKLYTKMDTVVITPLIQPYIVSGPDNC